MRSRSPWSSRSTREPPVRSRARGSGSRATSTRGPPPRSPTSPAASPPAPAPPPPPAGYLYFAALASQARVVLTDSGGVQKEAYWYEVPCVTLRENTEWVETVETGWNRLVGTDPGEIVAASREARPGPEHPSLYGDGHAADLIADVICTIGPSEA